MRDLPRANFLWLHGVQSEHSQLPAFTKDNEFAIGENSRAAPVHGWLLFAVRRPVFVATPHEMTTPEFNAAEARIRLVASAEGIEESVVQHGRVEMKLQHRRRIIAGGRIAFERVCRTAPKFIEGLAIRFYAQSDGADPIVRGRYKYEIVLNDWRHGVDGFVDGGLKPATKADFAICWIQ